MKYIDEFRNSALCEVLVKQIHKESKHSITIMEVCGGHTMALHRFGIPSLLPSTVHLLSGPGCPVCVTGKGYIDNAVNLAMKEGVTVCTYGDLIRVPGSIGSLEKIRAAGGSVEVVYSPLQALDMASKDAGRRYVFLGIGFETTAPASAVVLHKALNQGSDNFFMYPSHKLMPPAMAAIIHAGVKVDAYLCPGHVSTITGTEMYEPLVRDFGVGCVIAGFEPVDLLQSLLMLIRQHEHDEHRVEIQYTRAVTREGNVKARELVAKCFEPCDSWWRGLGLLPLSGLKISHEYSRYDAALHFTIQTTEPPDPPGCLCGEVLKGLVKPPDCPLFDKDCSPVNPVGACMVSAEGACQSYYRYAQR